MKNIDWNTWTLPIGWPVQGLWPEPSDAIPVALLTSTHRSNNQALIAAADEFGGTSSFVISYLLFLFMYLYGVISCTHSVSSLLFFFFFRCESGKISLY